MNKSTYIRLATNPHYKFSEKQKIEIAKLKKEHPELHTQQVVGEDLNVIKFTGKRDVSRS